MQAIPRRVEFRSGKVAVSWLGHNALWFGAIGAAFFLGAGWQNGQATREAITSVQTQYQGKLDFHRQNEAVIAKTAKAALDACQHNLSAALNNDASRQEIKGCPPVPPVVKAVVPATK